MEFSSSLSRWGPGDTLRHSKKLVPYFNPEIVAREHVDGARVARCQLALVHGPHELRTCIKLICHGGEPERLVIGVRPERILLGYSAATTILNDCALDSRSHNIHDLVVSILQQFG